jgi:hypothetical protein
MLQEEFGNSSPVTIKTKEPETYNAICTIDPSGDLRVNLGNSKRLITIWKRAIR